MSDFLRIIGCPTVFVEMWRDIMLFFGVLMALTGFYFGCQIEYSDLPSKVCVLSLFLLGISGVFLTAYAIALYIMAEIQRFSSAGRQHRITVARVRQVRSHADLPTQLRSPPPPYELVEGVRGHQPSPGTINVTISNDGNFVKIANL